MIDQTTLPPVSDKSPIKAIFNEGLTALFAALKVAAHDDHQNDRMEIEENNVGGDPIAWYFSKRLGWQAVVKSPAYLYTEHYGAAVIPHPWIVFTGHLRREFRGKPTPTVRQIWEWTQTPHIQALLVRFNEVQVSGGSNTEGD